MMQTDYTGRRALVGPGRVWILAMQLAGLFLAVAVLLVGLFVVLPFMLVGGIVLSFYLRRRLRQMQRRPTDEGVIDAEYTVIEHR